MGGTRCCHASGVHRPHGPALAADPIKICVSGPFTGGSSSMGVSMRDGVKLAVEEINKAGGAGGLPRRRPLEPDPIRSGLQRRATVARPLAAWEGGRTDEPFGGRVIGPAYTESAGEGGLGDGVSAGQKR
jgi:hypothetical protein